MDASLIPHPNASPKRVTSVIVAIEPTKDGLDLTYVVEGDPSHILVPRPQKPYRADGLWRTTCLELFIRDGEERYREFNLSPSSQWAAYRFTEYRSQPEPLALDEPPKIHFSPEPFGFMLTCIVRVHLGASALVGLSAVIEETDGTKSYWALKHPPGAPDFHHPDCFVLELPPAV